MSRLGPLLTDRSQHRGAQPSAEAHETGNPANQRAPEAQAAGEALAIGVAPGEGHVLCEDRRASQGERDAQPPVGGMNDEVGAAAGHQDVGAGSEAPGETGLEAHDDAIRLGDIHRGRTERAARVLPAEELRRMRDRHFAWPFAEGGLQQLEHMELVLGLETSHHHPADMLREIVDLGDAPSCSVCGSIMTRNGSCYRCMSCGSTSGCS